MLAREGSQAPGKPDGIVFDSFFGPDVSESGLALVDGTLRGAGIDETNDQAFWLGPPDDLQLILSEDDTPAGVEPGVTFDLSQTRDAFVNARGDVILATGLRGPGIDGSNDGGIWARDALTGEWIKIIREGDLFDGRIARGSGGFTLTYNPGGRSVNDDGLLSISVSFGGGDLAMYAVQIPAPSALYCLLPGYVFVTYRKRNWRHRANP